MSLWSVFRSEARLRVGPPSGLSLIVLLLCLSDAAVACSIELRCRRDIEMHRNFVVVVEDAHMPLRGAQVEIVPEEGLASVTQLTGSDGSTRFTGLAAGKYKLWVRRLGIPADYQCFHISKWTMGVTAKRKLTIDWGADSSEMRQAAGQVLGADAPMSDVKLVLRNGSTEKAFDAKSGPEGFFDFGVVPAGTYVLHVEGGEQSYDGEYEAGDLLIRLNPVAKREKLLLKREVSRGGGDCESVPLKLIGDGF